MPLPKGTERMGSGTRLCAGAVLAALPVMAPAQDDPLPSFQACIDTEVARYERNLRALRATEADRRSFDIGDVRGFVYCGSVGIVRCDRSDAPLPCQRALEAEQDALRAEVLAALPEPAGPAREGFAEQLYATLWDLAHGVSAGADCAGMDDPMQSWCAAWEANSRLKTAVLLWQAGRYLDRAAPATEVGWASIPPPTRPRVRPED